MHRKDYYKIAHFIAGIIMMYNGILLVGKDHLFYSLLNFTCGAMLLSFAGLYKHAMRILPRVNAIVLASEVTIFIFLSIYFTLYREGINVYVTAGIAIVFFALLILTFLKKNKRRRRKKPANENLNPYKGYKMMKDEEA